MSYLKDLEKQLNAEIEKTRKTGESDFRRICSDAFECAYEEGDQAVITLCKLAEDAHDAALKEWEQGHQDLIKAREQAYQENVNALLFEKDYQDSLEYLQYH